MTCRFLSIFNRVVKFLSREKMPIWLSFLIAIVTGLVAYYGTYNLIPRIDYQLRIQEIRAQYIIENVRSVNGDTRSLISSVRRFAFSISDLDEPDEKLRQNMLDQISELQWRVIDLDLIFENKADKQMITGYKSSLTKLRKSIESIEHANQLQSLFLDMEQFAVSSYILLRELYDLVGFKISITPLNSEIETEP